jgi:hypothetical protein
MPLFLNQSDARRRFKDVLGQANHLLITILVGLYGVESGQVTQYPKEFRVAWNPLDPSASANRSRIMALEMALVRATDALDVYISLARRKPSILQDKEVQDAIDGCDRSILNKLSVIKEAYLPADSVFAAMGEVMIAWRNRQVHSLSDNEVSATAWEILRNNQTWIKEEFRGMEVDRLLSDFQREGAPTFKEIASFIRATHEIVRVVDERVLAELDAEKFLRSLIDSRIGRDDASRRKHVQSVWGRDISERDMRVRSFLINCGLSATPIQDGTPRAFDDGLLTKISRNSPSELRQWLLE